MNHLSAERFTPEPTVAETTHATPEYTALLHETSRNLPPNHNIVYVPFNSSQATDEAEHLTYATTGQLPELLRGADVVVSLSRDEAPTPNYTDQYPEYNITLTPSGRSNVDTSVALWELA